jgi:hypothetical protein
MHEVYVNGVRQCPGIDYLSAKNAISFNVPPIAGADIMVSTALNKGGRHVVTLQGNGSTYLFQIDNTVTKRLEIYDLLDDIEQYHEVPAIAEALERLQVLLKLVKQDDNIR